MKRRSIAILLWAGLSIFLATGCKPDPSFNPDTGTPVSFYVPDGWPSPVYTFENNTLTQAGFDLGKKLFYDTRLSRDNTISCGSCHQQFAAFSHLDHPLSHGIDGLFGVRNSPSLFNMAWHPAFFWDGGVNHIEVQPFSPITNPVEMDETMDNVVAKLNADSDYPAKFKAVFGDNTITSQRIFKALAQFMCALISDKSKYDKYKRGEPGGELTTQEMTGLNLFRQKCASCHTEPLFTDFSYRNNGLLPNPNLNDSGRGRITLAPEDMHRFKVPSLRNVTKSAPYMHDGRFNTLEQVLQHYRTGITYSATLDTLLTNGISMTDDEQAAVISFLKTLTDDELLKDQRFAEP